MMNKQMDTRRQSRRAVRHSSGLTLVEMLLAMAITGVIGAAIAAMLFSIAQGTAERNDLRSIVVRQKILATRINSVIRESKMILQMDNDYIILWTGDDNGDEVPNKAEIRVIEYDWEAREVSSAAASFPANWTAQQVAAANTAYTLNDDFRSITNALRSDPYFPSLLWSRGVTAWLMTINADEPQQANLVSYRLTLQASETEDVTINAATLRNFVP